jgi:hypothetical protein
VEKTLRGQNAAWVNYMQHYVPQGLPTLHPASGLSNVEQKKTLGSCMVQTVPLYILQNYTILNSSTTQLFFPIAETLK